MHAIKPVSEIEQQRRRARISMSELCRHAGIHLQTYRRWRAGDSSPTLRRLEQINQAMARLTTPEPAE